MVCLAGLSRGIGPDGVRIPERLSPLAASTLVIPYTGRTPVDWLKTSSAAWRQAGVNRAILVGPAGHDRLPEDGVRWVRITTGQPFSGEVWREVLLEAAGEVVFCVNGDAGVAIGRSGLDRLASVLLETGSPFVYCHYLEEAAEGMVEHATIDYQLGSVRDGFDFGPVIALSLDAIRLAEQRFGPLSDSSCGALYDLRLRLSVAALPLRVPECLYACRRLEHRPTGQQQFDYVDPRNREAQEQMERIVTDHLKRIGAWLEPQFDPVPGCRDDYPVLASVVIPVRNREKTVADAARSALSQATNFPFNVIVVDNHSTDGTTRILDELAASDPRLVHLVPQTTDLQIGGCWNLAIQASRCGRYAVQLDSDDLYSSPGALQIVVDKLREGPYAMVVASYQLVNFQLQEIPPGLIDHREWTRDNGRNNLLRVNGLGAPRAFDTSVARRCPFPNVSYGEDYAAGLRISREYDIGRVFESVYLCRRWEGNTDANLPLATKNRHDAYKDRIRTMEILARQQSVAKGRLKP